MSGVVILTLPKPKPAIQTFAEDFVQTANRTSQLSLITGQVMALGLSQSEYRVLKFERGRWETLATTAWPDSAHVDFEKEKTRITLEKDVQPLVMFEPTGATSIFSLDLMDSDHTYTFKSIGDGRGVNEYGPMREAGFTLIEVLAALLLFSLAIIGLSQTATQSVRTVGVLEERVLAGIVADNQIVLARQEVLRVGTQSGEATAMSRQFTYTLETRNTPTPNFYELKARVMLAGSDQVLIERTAYRRGAS